MSAGVKTSKYLDKKNSYQFELCEKPVIELPKQYKNKSVVIMDGPFMCIDPLGDSGLHVMGNVVHAIHSTNVGKFPEYDSKFDELLNKGIVKNKDKENEKKIDEELEKNIDMKEEEDALESADSLISEITAETDQINATKTTDILFDIRFVTLF